MTDQEEASAELLRGFQGPLRRFNENLLNQMNLVGGDVQRVLQAVESDVCRLRSELQVALADLVSSGP